MPKIKAFFPISACSANANAQIDSPIKHKQRRRKNIQHWDTNTKHFQNKEKV